MRQNRARALALAALLPALLPALFLAGPALARPQTTAVALPGLAAPGEIVTDRWGIPHIYAASANDAFFLQGYTVARDRLWQIDLWRKRGLGRLAASFGPAFAEQDRAARLFLYRGDMAAEWASYAPGAQGWTVAFAAGINARIAEIAAARAAIPPEFTATGSQPETWIADDIVRIRTHALVANIGAEVARAQSLCAGGLPYEPLRRSLKPAHEVSLPKDFDPCLITPATIHAYTLATANVKFENGTIVTAAPDNESLDGSNNWVVAPSRTATGRPMLASDPHREHSVPSLRTLVHLEAPGLSISGAGEPAMPGIAFGHNDKVAWAFTIFAIDQQDLIVYNSSQPLMHIIETIEIKGAAAQTVDLAFTAQGPVIATDSKGNSFAIRAIWDRPGTSPYSGATWMFGAQNWADFLKAREHWGAPPENLVFADRRGDIGWAASGFGPVRTNDGLVPVSGDAANDWQGLRPADALPSLRNPASGWYASANQMNLPAGFAFPTAYEWADDSRMDRIEAVLGANAKVSLADSMALQIDETSMLARRATAMLANVTGETPDQKAALAMLRAWNGVIAADSAAAALFEIWQSRHLAPAAVAAIVPAAARPAFVRADPNAVIDVLEARHPMLGGDANRAAILKTSLAAAWVDATALMGPEPATWKWGSLHQARWSPALALPGRAAEQMVGPLPVGGAGSTPRAGSHRGTDLTLAHGASVRMVIDVGAWDNSVVINTPGQSGDLASPHYRDLFPLWAAGKYVPMLWSRPRVLAEAESIIRAVPAR